MERKGYMNWQYLIDNSIAIGVIVAWTAALALVIICKWEEMIVPGEPLLLSTLFSWAWFRHLEIESHDAQYEVCDKLVCRIAWALENWLWYGGKAVP